MGTVRWRVRLGLGLLVGTFAMGAAAQVPNLAKPPVLPGPCRVVASARAAATGSAAPGTQAPQPPPPVLRPTFALPPNPDCPDTLGKHVDRYLNSQFSLAAAAQPLVTVVPDDWMHTAGFPGGGDGFADRYRSEFLQEATGKLTRHLVFPAIFHQDEDYAPLGDGYPTGMRIRNALRHLLFTASADHTHEVFNMEALPAAGFDAVVANDFEPASERTTSTIIQNIGWSIGWRIAGDLLTEFEPDLRRLAP